MKKIVFHIGANKTGTTAIQNFLSKNDDLLLREHSLLYPKNGRVWGAHFPVAWELGLGTAPISLSERYKTIWNDLKNEIYNSDAETIVISSENFILLKDEKKLDKIINTFPDFTFEIILFVRRQDLWLESLYLQRIKMGVFNKNFDEFLDKPEQELDFNKILKVWSTLTNIDSIKVVNFDEARASGGAVRCFNRVLGLDISFEEEYLNDSIDKHFAEFMRSRKDIFSDPKRRNKLLGIYKDIKNNYDDHSKVLLNKEKRLKIINSYRDANISLYNNYNLDKEIDMDSNIIDADDSIDRIIIHKINQEMLRIIFNMDWDVR